jgi:hypothetical protein
MTTTVAQMTIDEFKGLIEEVIEKKLTEWIEDFDEELELREHVRNRLLRQQETTAAGERGQPLSEVVQQLGLE